ncbi:LysR family transcriptional regulator [Alkalilimnicola ehrlichii]|uniref:LysR family transcriptional regulator n=1 Tax=Alkalilimnicola ehrlichii TaxID=351052 RepID=A0A3E0X3N7_9GAMM|nr:LysR family transcriptional regulator [Alkalilimnicola ehrlichii]RFA31405.1 LysR family transcriptional regulator [Alkalilimnicola ehrlichii]RFA39324.1 LysR family transcriptional regulator [Alkalilimnicola ehrlichii]
MYVWEGVSEFVAVAEANSFTAAAERLGLSTALVSRRVQGLERRLSLRLFYRTTRKVSLTAEGALYYGHCRQALNALADAERAMGRLKDTPQGLVKLTAPVTYGEKYVLPLVNEFLVRYPEVSVTANLTNQPIDLIEGGYDLAIRLGKLSSSSLIAKRLSSRTHYVCAAPAYLERHGAPHTLAELAHHNCLRGNYNYWRFQDQGRETTVRVRGRVTYNSGIGLLEAALKGIGLVQLPNYYVEPYLRSGELVSVLEPFQEADEGVWAVYPQSQHLSPKIRRLVDYLAEHLPKQEAS